MDNYQVFTLKNKLYAASEKFTRRLKLMRAMGFPEEKIRESWNRHLELMRPFAGRLTELQGLHITIIENDEIERCFEEFMRRERNVA